MGCAAITVLSQAAVAGAQTEKPVVQKLKHGEVNWTDKTVMATGSGAPNLKLPNVAAIRLNAERAAKLSAYRNVVETLRGVRINAEKTGKSALEQPDVRTQVEGIVRGCKVVDTRYYSDGGVDVVLKCPLDGGLATSMAPVKGQAGIKSGEKSEFSGLVVDATGLGVKPSLQPRIMDGAGRAFYTVEMVSPNALRQHGAAAYVGTVESARRMERVGKKPLVLKATRLSKSKTDLIVADVAALKEGSPAFLREARVVVVTGGR